MKTNIHETLRSGSWIERYPGIFSQIPLPLTLAFLSCTWACRSGNMPSPAMALVHRPKIGSTCINLSPTTETSLQKGPIPLRTSWIPEKYSKARKRPYSLKTKGLSILQVARKGPQVLPPLNPLLALETLSKNKHPHQPHGDDFHAQMAQASDPMSCTIAIFPSQ